MSKIQAGQIYQSTKSYLVDIKITKVTKDHVYWTKVEDDYEFVDCHFDFWEDTLAGDYKLIKYKSTPLWRKLEGLDEGE